MTEKNVKSKRAAEYMPIPVADYIADTMHLSTEQHGAYLLLLMHLHATGSLPAEDARLSRIARLSVGRWKGMRTTIMELVNAYAGIGGARQ